MFENFETKRIPTADAEIHLKMDNNKLEEHLLVSSQTVKTTHCSCATHKLEVTDWAVADLYATIIFRNLAILATEGRCLQLLAWTVTKQSANLHGA